ncbi:hypothetical protein [Sphingomonas solaris]|uniref:DUF768 domain-containing protein n=1 Tax=Alterirhizorhabdus solaris TaxID=2529389 RepID=A0A558R1M6_9SPHN|nr:hypothetical protein [Sphingomonas solaris]TVV73296.1 hypothetical protein FOY91_12660 [Sphingomonas solaris]
MSDLAKEFLTEWSLKRDPAPISHADATVAAERWEAEAAENGITPDELHEAAGGSIADYLLRTYGTTD